MVLLSTLNMIRHLTCGSSYNCNWFLKLNLMDGWLGQEVVCWFQYWKKLNSLHLTGLIIMLLLLMWKWNGLFLRKNHLLRCWGWLSLQDWIGTFTLSLLLKLLPRKLGSWLVLWSFFLLKMLCISSSINQPYGHVWNTFVLSDWCS